MVRRRGRRLTHPSPELRTCDVATLGNVRCPFRGAESDLHGTMTMHIQSLSADELVDELATFIELLVDAVAQGASLGFVAPVPRDAARRYWLSLRDEVLAGELRQLLQAARDAEACDFLVGHALDGRPWLRR